MFLVIPELISITKKDMLQIKSTKNPREVEETDLGKWRLRGAPTLVQYFQCPESPTSPRASFSIHYVYNPAPY